MSRVQLRAHHITSNLPVTPFYPWENRGTEVKCLAQICTADVHDIARIQALKMVQVTVHIAHNASFTKKKPKHERQWVFLKNKICGKLFQIVFIS